MRYRRTRKRSPSGVAGGARERMVGLPRSANFWDRSGQAVRAAPARSSISTGVLNTVARLPTAVRAVTAIDMSSTGIWSFTGYNMGEDRQLTTLPAQNIDTGMGLNVSPLSSREWMRCS